MEVRRHLRPFRHMKSRSQTSSVVRFGLQVHDEPTVKMENPRTRIRTLRPFRGQRSIPAGRDLDCWVAAGLLKEAGLRWNASHAVRAELRLWARLAGTRRVDTLVTAAAARRQAQLWHLIGVIAADAVAALGDVLAANGDGLEPLKGAIGLPKASQRWRAGLEGGVTSRPFGRFADTVTSRAAVRGARAGRGVVAACSHVADAVDAGEGVKAVEWAPGTRCISTPAPFECGDIGALTTLYEKIDATLWQPDVSTVHRRRVLETCDT